MNESGDQMSRGKRTSPWEAARASPAQGDLEHGEGGGLQVGFGQNLTPWAINVFSLWLAEIVSAPEPRGHESAGILMLALALYLLVAGVLAGAWHAVDARLAGWNSRYHRFFRLGVLPFLPGAFLYLPKVGEALRGSTAAAALMLGCGLLMWLSFVPSWLRASALGSRREQIVYFWSCLGLWLVAMRLRDVTLVLEHQTWDVVTGSIAFAISVIAVWVWSLWLHYGSGLRSKGGAGLFRLANLGFLLALSSRLALVAWPQFPASWSRFGPLVEQERAISTARPSVFLIVMDTTRVDHLSTYGYHRDTTPGLDRFAADAVVFEKALSTSPWTLPAHASLFTALLPLHHGALRRPSVIRGPDGQETRHAVYHGRPLGAEFLTWAEWLNNSGYSCGAFVANFAYLAHNYNLDQGFDIYEATPNIPVKPRILYWLHNKVFPIPQAARFWGEFRSAGQIRARTMRWLKRQGGRPVFAFLNFMEPHRSRSDYLEGPRFREFAAESERAGTGPPGFVPSDEIRSDIDRYDSQIAELDRNLDGFFQDLRRMNLFDSSLIIITADHGESFGEVGVFGHGDSLNETELHVPLLIKYPFSRRKGRAAEVVQLVDILPTIAEELDLPFPFEVDGDPIGAIEHPVLAEVYSNQKEGKGLFSGLQVSVHEGQWKMVRREDGETRLFDLVEDPWETVNVFGQVNEDLAHIEQLLRDRISGELEQRATDEALEAEELDPEARARLEALGYL